jgi:hypothetical protein
MISNTYDFAVFIKAMVGKDYIDILRLAEQEAYEVERRSYNVRGAPRAREHGSVHYGHELGEFLFFLNSGMKPAGVSEQTFASYRPVIEVLVERKQLLPSVLKFFTN